MEPVLTKLVHPRLRVVVQPLSEYAEQCTDCADRKGSQSSGTVGLIFAAGLLRRCHGDAASRKRGASSNTDGSRPPPLPPRWAWRCCTTNPHNVHTEHIRGSPPGRRCWSTAAYAAHLLQEQEQQQPARGVRSDTSTRPAATRSTSQNQAPAPRFPAQ
eukprot:SAG31_NODE_3971_length_3705_cov_3.354964_3_plen_158_part_00